ncbi:hypothetical protein [Dyadobacter arcticus]|uniref:DUF4142 domain-containing protein n=1 Tax=Dyadobacter arcticus TaxID=1078754 RepID=A0ABX0UPN1_9BACT|nr:hypothetical protein [Dyadobacter arcticus]NIJ54907.1 hypothetical protein [Dyadobacter arcticus]
MKRVVIIYFLSLLTLSTSGLAQADKNAFYKAFSSGEEATINKVLASLESEEATSRVNAYKGALTMKKAGFVKGVGGKLKTFKNGVHLLDDEIKSNPTNAEFRFLRLTIQENAPGILKYNKELNEDRQAIVKGYSQLDRKLKSVITDYAKDSKILKEADLK